MEATGILGGLGALGIALEVLRFLGLPGLIVLMWYVDRRDMARVLIQYKDDMKEVRTMYENNARLVKHYEDLAGQLKDVVTLNTQHMQSLTEAVRNNQFCPMLRKKTGEIEG
jgi:hypothetical protein